ncbi:ribosomal biogenesis factor-like [Aotus nancymaae]|uniref:ribosomal biogenesis factor-like n=1 Tax=Aotus nancymaae TaxID=37293 RepID=UPI0030FEBE46
MASRLSKLTFLDWNKDSEVSRKPSSLSSGSKVESTSSLLSKEPADFLHGRSEMSCDSLPQWLNKLRGQKSMSVFHTASRKHFKAKNKAKPVTSNLKKINTMNDEKVSRVDEAFVFKNGNHFCTNLINVQERFAHFLKGLFPEPLQKELIPQQHHENKLVNIDEATKQMAQF